MLVRAIGLGLLVVASGLFSGCSSTEPDEPDDEAGGEEEGALTSPDPNTAPKAAGPLRFRDACKGTERVTIAAVGDVLMHQPLQEQSYKSPDGFRSTWKRAIPLLQNAQFTYANLEGPTAPGVRAGGGSAPDPGKRFDGVVYSSYPAFNYHPSLIDDLLASGVDVVSTANNHAMDRASPGANKTLDELDARKLPHSGTKRAGANDPFYAITDIGQFKVAWLACAFSTNGIPDKQGQVLRCFDGEQVPGSKPNPEVSRTIEELSKRPEIDAVLVTPHWGIEYEYKPRDFQVRAAKAFIDAGATAVIGGHPHVIQPWDKVTAADGREAFVIYSLGNFAAGQLSSNGTPLLAQRTSLALYLGLSKAPGKKAWVNGAKYVPLFMDTTGGISVRPATKEEAEGSLAGKSRALSTRVFGEWDALEAGAPVVTNAECGNQAGGAASQ
jgi:poly-gamma-glutamate synthesis protein (capsule biosynthesis protein)